MRNKATAALLAAAIILLAALSALAQWAQQEDYANLLLVTPSAFGAPGLNPQRLEESLEDELLLTYEIRQTSIAQAINSSHSVTLTGTNPNYANLLGYSNLDGGFFTQAAWDAKNKHAVLNETAAFEVFGSVRITGQVLKLNGEPWIVTGVIQDDDADNANIYAPSSVTGGQAVSLMVLLDGGSITEAHAINALKSIGIHENSYDFINLSKSASAFDERLSVAWKAALFAAILLISIHIGGRLAQDLRFYRNRLREIYPTELLIYHRADALKSIAGVLLLSAGVAAMLLLSLGILETCLTWQEITPITGELAAGDFGGKLVWLRNCQWIDTALFAAYIGVILLCFSLALRPWAPPKPARPWGAAPNPANLLKKV